MIRLLADIGGTNTRCGMLDEAGEIRRVRRFRNAGSDGPGPLLQRYLDELTDEQRPCAALLAVAAPLRSDTIEMINIDWSFSLSALGASLGLAEIEALNDFEALAWGLPEFSDEDLYSVGGGVPAGRGPMAVLGPGTGLGVAALIPTSEGDWQAVAGEGGHVTLPATDDREAEIIALARARFGHCSAERLVSGPGVGVLHELLHGSGGIDAAHVGELADEGDPSALETLDVFFRLLGNVAGNLALTLGAYGGVFIGGGIVPRHLKHLRTSGFRDRFESKGRYRDYLRKIPTRVIVAEHPTLRGLAARARRTGG